jgi:hypothetical protein
MDGNQVQMIDLDKDKNKQQAGAAPAGAGPSQPTGQQQPPAGQQAAPVAQPAPVAGAGMQPQAAKPASKGTGFVGIRRILGASQGSRLGQQVGGRVQQAGKQARAGITGARQEFQIQAGRAGQEMEKQAGAAQEAVSGILGGTGEVAAPTAEQQAAFQKTAAGQYIGPKELTGAEQLASKTYEAQQLGRLAGSTAGRQELLQQQFGSRGGYGAKLSALDALILGKTGGKELAQAKAGTAGLEKELATGQMAASEQAKALQAKAAGFGKEALGALSKGATDIKSATEAKLKEETPKIEKDYTDLIEGLKTGEIRSDLMKYLPENMRTLPALSDEQAKDLVAKVNPTLQNVISKAQLSQVKALEKLGGKAGEGVIGQQLSPFAGLEAPTEESKVSLDKEKLSTANKDYEDAYKRRREELRSTQKDAEGFTYNDRLELAKWYRGFGNDPNNPGAYEQYQRHLKGMLDIGNQNAAATAAALGGARKTIRPK